MKTCFCPMMIIDKFIERKSSIQFRNWLVNGMSYRFDQIPINNPKFDKRVKLTDEQRESIRNEYALGGISQRGLEKKYDVSRRLIQFVLSPEKLEKAKKDFSERRRDGRLLRQR